MEDRTCKECGRPWRTYTYTPCDKGPDCWECELFAGMDDDHAGEHADSVDDVDEVVSYQCPHGVEYALICRGCGAEVSSWGIGAAGFGELCGCEVIEE